MKKIELTQGKVALIDDDDFDRVSQHHWYAKKSRNTFYAEKAVRIDGKQTSVKMHRFIMGHRKGEDIDHGDGNGLNNQKVNLRICTRSQNCMNRRIARGKSEYKGACWHKRIGKWQVRIQVDGKRVHLGYFESEDEAGKAYNKAAKKYFGEYAYLNEVA